MSSRIPRGESADRTPPSDDTATRPTKLRPGAASEPGAKTIAPETTGTETGAPKPRLPLTARLILGLLLFLAGLFLTLALSVIPPIPAWSQASMVNAAILTVALSVMVCVLVVVFIASLTRYVDRRPFRDTGWVWTRASLPLLGVGLLISVAITGVTCLVLAAFDLAQTQDLPWAEITTSMIVLTIVTALAQAFFLQGIPEEVFFRGYIFQTLRERPKLALAISTVYFGILHVFSQGGQETVWDRALYLVPASGFGFLAAVLLLRLRSLWPAVGVHAGAHVGTLILGFLGLGTGGAWAWLAVGAVYAIVGALILRGHRWATVRIDR